MGTASTMTAIAETLGLTLLPGASSIPAVDMAHLRMAAESGRQIVENAWRGLGFTQVCFRTLNPFTTRSSGTWRWADPPTRSSHLIAMAARAGVSAALEQFDQISQHALPGRPADRRAIPNGRFLLRRRPALPCSLQLLDLLPRGCADRQWPQHCAKTLPERGRSSTTRSACPRDKAIASEWRHRNPPRKPSARGGAVLKYAAMEPRFMRHTGSAVVFRDYNDLAARIDDPGCS